MLGQAAGAGSLKPVHLFRGVAEFGHLDGLADVFRAQDHTLGGVASQVRVMTSSATSRNYSHV